MEKVSLECKPGIVRERISSASDGAEVSIPDCFCAYERSVLESTLEMQVELWRSRSSLAMGTESPNAILYVDVTPEEPAEITLYCVTPGQLAAYRDAILAEEAGAEGDG